MAKIAGIDAPDSTPTTLGSLSVLDLYSGKTAETATSTDGLSKEDQAVVDSGAISTYNTGLQDFAQATSSKKSSEGYLAERDAYNTASLIADQQARLARVSGDIGQYQEQRTINKTLGEQRADIASAGFAKGGSGVYLARDSAYQGALEKSLIGLNAEIRAGGYLEEGAASTAEAKAAQAASDAALALADAATSAGTLNTSLAVLQAKKAADALDTTGTSSTSTTKSTFGGSLDFSSTGTLFNKKKVYGVNTTGIAQGGTGGEGAGYSFSGDQGVTPWGKDDKLKTAETA